MTKMTDAFKKIFLGLGGDPKELAENNDVGDYILDLEGAIKKTASDAVDNKTVYIPIKFTYDSSTQTSTPSPEDDSITLTTIKNMIDSGKTVVLTSYSSNNTRYYHLYQKTDGSYPSLGFIGCYYAMNDDFIIQTINANALLGWSQDIRTIKSN